MARNDKAFAEAIAALRVHYSTRESLDIRTAFARDDQRFARFSIRVDDLLFDYSKSAVNQQTIALLLRLCDAADVVGRQRAMFAGEEINTTEKRAVLHTKLREPKETKFFYKGVDIISSIHDVLEKMVAFAQALRQGELLGASGAKITDVVNIGIGGSSLGPAMTTLALTPYHDGPRCHFVSNIDSSDIHDCLSRLSAQTTLFIIASKTFTTVETMTNAQVARNWIAEQLGEKAVPNHFAAVSTALNKVREFGIEERATFGFWDWVGGRYSVWSAIGLPLLIAIGPQNFYRFLAGGHAIDEHFATAQPEKNMPIIMGLIGYWQRVICKQMTRAVIPYEARLARLPAYLQQLDMESNGKTVDLDGQPTSLSTGPVVWGEPGTDSQHAFFQLLHQGTDIIPVEFIVFSEGHEPALINQHKLLIANCLAQSHALVYGRREEEVMEKLTAAGLSHQEAARLAPHRRFPGNRPSMTIAQAKLTPYSLGRLIALYEHRVFVEGVLMNINSFDQWGVELGKDLAQSILPLLTGGAATTTAFGADGVLAYMLDQWTANRER